MTYFIEELPYIADGSVRFSHIRQLPNPVFLDSAPLHQNKAGRYDIISAAPVAFITTRLGKSGSVTTTLENGKTSISHHEPFEILKQEIARFKPNKLPQDKLLPFYGGAIGYFSYDLGRCIEYLPHTAKDDITLPGMEVGIYCWALINDHEAQKSYFMTTPNCPADTQEKALSLCKIERAIETDKHFKLNSPFNSNFTLNEYQKAFDKIQDYIHAGDCYQVNLAQRFSATFEGEPWHAYQQLRQKMPAPFSAYIESVNGYILSHSPERFLKCHEGIIETKPIKGTRARGKTPIEDKQLADELINSAKDRSENLMIVDLLRNDLGKSCEAGSIHVPKLFDLESFANVHHLVSTIEGKLSADVTPVDAFFNCFPGGSITGAPKLRAMEIIEELEPHRRSLYCGSVAYISFDNQMDSSIAIRTLVTSKNTIHCWGGGGIVADSNSEQEYQETLTKVSSLLNTLEAL
jgi:para-aminobenzoate synthetase component 1